MITIFANLRVGNEKGLQHLKDSFFTLRDVSDNWLINVRGDKRLEAAAFLKENLGNKLTLFEFFDEKYWFRDSLKMMAVAKYDYIIFWNEDHLSLVPNSTYYKVVTDMKKEGVDYLQCSWWLNGKTRRAFEIDKLKNHQYIDSVYLTKSDWKKQLKKGYEDYLIATQAIFKKEFLIKLMRGELNKLPRSLTKYIYFIMIVAGKFGCDFHHRRLFDFLNRIFFGKLTKKNFGPFDIEKSPFRWDILPLKFGLPREELMACIDDDLGEPGYQLIKRGLYPVNILLNLSKGQRIQFEWGEEELLEDNDNYVVRKYYLKQGHKFSKIYYQDECRIESYPRETVINMGGELRLRMNGQELAMRQGDIITIYPNIKHEIVSLGDDGEFISMIAKEIDTVR